MRHLYCLALVALPLSGCAVPGANRPPAAGGSPTAALFPAIDAPRASGYLRVSPTHELYYEESGNPAGKPVVFLHGGPGSGTKPKQRRFFDPQAYRIILFDQAGAGKSRASGDVLAENNTAALVAHLEALRAHLKIERMMLFGGSWGSTLALAYAERYPTRVSELVLWGAFLGRPREIDWLYRRGGVSQIYPDAFERFESFIPPGERADLVGAYLRRFDARDPLVRREAVRRWTAFEDEVAILEWQPPESHGAAELDDLYLRRSRIEATYMARRAFVAGTDGSSELLAGAGRLRDIPVVIVAARYDLVCPHVTAHELKAAMPWAELKLVPLAGHLSLAHESVTRALVETTERFKR